MSVFLQLLHDLFYVKQKQQVGEQRLDYHINKPELGLWHHNGLPVAQVADLEPQLSLPIPLSEKFVHNEIRSLVAQVPWARRVTHIGGMHQGL